MFAPFLPFTSERLHGFFGYEIPLFGEQYTEEVSDSLGTHRVLKYKGVDGLQWKPSELTPGKKLESAGAAVQEAGRYSRSKKNGQD